MVMLYDTVRLKKGRMRKTDDGYLVGRARVARTGIQIYAGSEVGRPDMPIVRVYRPESAVFAEDSMQTYAGRPMTNDHPAEDVTATNWRDLSVGNLGNKVVRDGEFVEVDYAIMDAAMVQKVDEGKAELSAGYSATLKWGAGKTPDGQDYDAEVGNLRINHMAIVDRARGGSALRLGDSRNPEPDDSTPAQPPHNEETHPMKTIFIDGVAVQVADDTAASIIERHIGKLTDSNAQLTATAQALKDGHSTVLAQKDAELVELSQKLKDAEGRIQTPEQIEAAAAARAALVATAQSLHDADYAGKSDAEIRKLVVTARFGDARVEGKDETYIAAAFQVLQDMAPSGQTGTQPDPVRTALNDAKTEPTAAPNNYNDPLVPTGAQAARIAKLADAWKGATAQS